MGASPFFNKSKQQKTLIMDNPTHYSDGLTQHHTDSPLRIQNKMLGALKNMGGDATSAATQTIATVTAVAGEILAANTACKFLTLQNVGTHEVYVKFGSNPVASGGGKSFAFVLKPASAADGGDGGVLSLQTYTGSVHAVTLVGSSDVAVTQFT